MALAVLFAATLAACERQQPHSPAPHATARPSGRPSLLARTENGPPPVGLQMTVLQIVNNVAGAGILTLSAGMTGGVGSVPAALLCLALGAISGVTFHLIGASCELTKQTSFKVSSHCPSALSRHGTRMFVAFQQPCSAHCPGRVSGQSRLEPRPHGSSTPLSL